MAGAGAVRSPRSESLFCTCTADLFVEAPALHRSHGCGAGLAARLLHLNHWEEPGEERGACRKRLGRGKTSCCPRIVSKGDRAGRQSQEADEGNRPSVLEMPDGLSSQKSHRPAGWVGGARDSLMVRSRSPLMSFHSTNSNLFSGERFLPEHFQSFPSYILGHLVCAAAGRHAPRRPRLLRFPGPHTSWVVSTGTATPLPTPQRWSVLTAAASLHLRPQPG